MKAYFLKQAIAQHEEQMLAEVNPCESSMKRLQALKQAQYELSRQI